MCQYKYSMGLEAQFNKLLDKKKAKWIVWRNVIHIFATSKGEKPQDIFKGMPLKIDHREVQLVFRQKHKYNKGNKTKVMK